MKLDTKIKCMAKKVSAKDSFAKAEKIETLVKLMFEKTGQFTVYHYGYNKLLPEIASRQNYSEKKGCGISGVKQVRAMPDLFMVDEKRKKGKD